MCRGWRGLARGADVALRPSSIDGLPEQAREALHTWLRDPGITQKEAAQRTNALLEELGLPQRVTRQAVNRYDLRMREVGEKLRQSRQVSEQWIAKLGSAPGGKLGPPGHRDAADAGVRHHAAARERRTGSPNRCPASSMPPPRSA